MGIIRLTLITLALIWGVMYFYGSDEGLPEDRLGRDPVPEEIAVVPLNDTEAPATRPDIAPPVEEPPVEALADAVPPAPEPAAPAVETTQAPSAPEVLPEPEPEPEPQPELQPELQPEPEPARDVVLYVSGRVVNVRSGPSTAFAAITSLRRGAAVVDLGDAGDGWRQIRLDTGETGYMSGDFLSTDPQ